MNLKNLGPCIVLSFLGLFTIPAVYGQEREKKTDPFVFFLPVGYDLLVLEEQTLHSPVGGAGFLVGEQDLPFDRIERRLMGLAAYQSFIFTREPFPGSPKTLHQIGGVFDARVKRHQILALFGANSDKPLFGGINTFQFAAGYGYEIVRRPRVSLILGAMLGVKDFGITLPSGDPWLLVPLPLIRFGVDSRWFASSFDFIAGPGFNFTLGPKERIRFTGNMSMETYRSIEDINCEFTVWYRLFKPDHKLGDFAGIGAGFKHGTTNFDLSSEIKAETFGLRRTSVFAVIDLSFLKIQGGWVIDSHYLLEGEKTGVPGKGFFFSVQGMIPVYRNSAPGG
ncbi:MAG: hypothetical protein LBC31_04620 [Treponema sp.]|jgi:hypothetical protein|nr:hypothetical protein [Treponema sp.]